MPRLLFAVAVAMWPMLAMADQSISGQWVADPGHGVEIVMDIMADGHWFSTTVQDGKVVAEMAGTYEQTKANDATGKLVFTPIKVKTSSEHGPAVVEQDDYTLLGNGAVLTLSTAGEPMEFRKQAFAK